MITKSDVHAARQRIAGHVRVTPIVAVDPGRFGAAAQVWFKLEQTQHAGSFKARGAYNRILGAAERGELPEVGVVAASGGNHGLAVAFVAAQSKTPARIYVPENAPPVKVAKLHKLGTEVVQVGQKYADAYEAGAKYAVESGALFCHAYDQPDICSGQGTLGIELLEQTGGQLDTILVAVGGGGLLAGIAAATEGQVRVVGVEPANAPTLHAALAAGQPVDVPVSGVAADSLGASRAGDIACEVARRTGVVSALVSDADIVAARAMLWNEWRLVVEHGAAAPVAALIAGAYRPAAGERIVILLCGGNTDPGDLIGNVL
ncbi:MAG TPA: threonine/serine dehydratase [Streptosporangiaceae bacterium]|jgi:threonine dehydratase